MKTLVAAARDAVRSTLWPIPALAVIVALAVGMLLPLVDRVADDSLSDLWGRLLFDGDAGAASTVLSSVASSLITVTSLTFSLTVVTLQLASSQFSPRLLRTFTRDLFVQGTLALFLATFTYSLTVLRGVRQGGDKGDPVVPRMAVSLSYVLAVASVLALVAFLAHLARQIRVETMLRDVHRDADGAMRGFLDPLDEADDGPPPPAGPADAGLLLAPSSGFLIRIDQDRLLSCAVEANAVIEVDAHPGSFLVPGVPIGRAWTASGGRLDPDTADRLLPAAAGCLHTGIERTVTQDVGYGLRQLTDVVNKALSPGINDPTTAVHALGHVSVLLCDLADRRLGDVVLRDDRGHPRVLLHRPDLEALLEASLAQPRRYGAADPQVLGRLFRLLVELGWRARPADGPVVLRHLGRLHDVAAAGDFDAHERLAFADLEHEVRSAVALVARDGRPVTRAS